MLTEGDSVGADARLAQAATLRVQEASLTGESEAVLKTTTTLPAPAALGDRLDMVFKGTSIVQGTGRAIVTATGMQSRWVRSPRCWKRPRGAHALQKESGGSAHVGPRRVLSLPRWYDRLAHLGDP